MSKLAVIGKIVMIEAIPKADRIKAATVVCGDAGRWVGVVGLDHHIGELVTVFLQDAILPPDERWAFMEKHHHRVRMSRFRGCPSECVIVKGAPEMSIGTDLTEALGVTKHHKPLPASLAGDIAGAFPSFVPKTDEPNFQTVPELVERMGQDAWVATLKCDGSSCTVWKDEAGELHVASRNWELREFTATGAGNSYWRAARKYDWNGLPAGCALQLEVVGPGIQGNPMGLDDVEGRAFTLYDYTLHRKMGQVVLDAIANLIGVPQAPVLLTGEGGLYSNEQLRKLAEVTYPNGKPGEGIVIRDMAHSWSMKIINLLYKEAA